MISPERVRRVVALTLGADLAATPFLAGRFAGDSSDPFVMIATGWIGVALAVVGVGCAVAFGRKNGDVGFAMGAVICGVVLQEGLGRASGIYFEPFFLTGTVALGWLLGWTFATGVRADVRTWAPHGALAGLAAVYTCAGLSKLAESGLAWATDPVHVRAMILAHHRIDGLGLVEDVASLGWMGIAIASCSLAAEMGAVLMLFGKRARLVESGTLLAFHVGLFALTGILFAQGALLLFVLGGWGEPLVMRARRKKGLGAAAGLATVAVAVGWGVSLTQVSGLPGPIMVGLLGAWLVIESVVSEDEEEDEEEDGAAREPKPRLERNRVLWAVGALAAVLAALAFAPVRTHPLDEATEAVDRE